MKIIYSQTFNAYHNIACEEYLLDNFEDDIFYLYQNSPSIIVGRKQNTLAEINFDYIREKQIPVVRRLSGGGAVYHDVGNLNFCFIIRNVSKAENGFERYTLPILEVLQSLGVEAKLEGRNDLTIEGKKFSGNAKYFKENDLLQHGTILYMSKLNEISKVLNVNPAKYKDKAVKSVQSRVTNISSHMPKPMNLSDFTNLIIAHIKTLYPEATDYMLTDKDNIAINRLVDKKYKTWEWNHGKTPAYNYSKSLQTKGGNLEVAMFVKNGVIEQLKFYGDFFSFKDIDTYEMEFIGVPHEYEKLKDKLEAKPAELFFENINSADLLEIFF